MTDLEELAGRVEGLTGPSSEIDGEIALATGKLPAGAVVMGLMYAFVASNGERAVSFLPRYTASIDAAMTLIEAESWIEIKGPRKYLNIPTPVPNKWSASVAQWNHEGEGIGWGATPALTLTAAALRALSRTQGNQNG